ncbi:unknown protein [Parachlamydia acanthamoebae UV-7]|uniref:Uncharacterized protein n=1 Tax=Parachlamydia acanthamoebae (strain UV7) TaxID=765952 RepID=F8KYY7_PARAV|nr:unknown protein [Parachlamydia acanthamoebae UV-7]
MRLGLKKKVFQYLGLLQMGDTTQGIKKIILT